jgi:hypothetical protein
MGAPKKPRAKKAKPPATMKEAAAMANAPKGQQRIAVDDRDVQRIHASHEVPRPMSDAAFKVAAAQAAREHNKIKAIEAEIHDFANGARCTPQGMPLPSRKAEIRALRESSEKLDREIAEEAHLILTPCIELHDVNRGIVTIYLDDNGIEGEKVKERRMTDAERKKASEGAPFAPPVGEPEAIDEDAPAESHGSALDDRETPSQRQGGLPFGTGDDDAEPEEDDS